LSIDVPAIKSQLKPNVVVIDQLEQQGAPQEA